MLIFVREFLTMLICWRLGAKYLAGLVVKYIEINKQYVQFQSMYFRIRTSVFSRQLILVVLPWLGSSDLEVSVVVSNISLSTIHFYIFRDSKITRLKFCIIQIKPWCLQYKVCPHNCIPILKLAALWTVSFID